MLGPSSQTARTLLSGRSLPAAVLLSASALSAACSNGHMRADIAGEYELVSVNGQPLPARIYERDSVYQDVVSGTLSLTESGIAAVATRLEQGMLGMTMPQHDSATGRYTYSNGLLNVNLNDITATADITATMYRTGDELTFKADERLVFVYRRR